MTSLFTRTDTDHPDFHWHPLGTPEEQAAWRRETDEVGAMPESTHQGHWHPHNAGHADGIWREVHPEEVA